MQKKKALQERVYAGVLVAIMLLTMIPASAFAQSKTAAGSWTDAADVSWFNAANKKTMYTLSTPQQVAGFAKIVSGGETFRDITVQLSGDVDLGEKQWKSAGAGSTNTPFKGTFDGKDHLIKNLTIDENQSGSGFFRALNQAVVKNLRFSDVNISAKESAGIICGYSENGSKISNITAEGEITGIGNWIGGITGNNDGSHITNCNVDVVLSSPTGSTCGLLAGWSGGNGSTIKSCTVKGSVSGTEWCGGAVGSSENTEYVSVFSDVTVTSTANSAATGGLLGWSGNDTLSFCHSSGSVIHETGANGGYTGGLVGWLEKGNVKRCHSDAAVAQRGNAGNVGGLVGYFNSMGASGSGIFESASTGSTVQGADRSTVGGFAGNFTGTIENCYAANNVITGGQLNESDLSAEAGAFAGIFNTNSRPDEMVKNCYATGNVKAGKVSDDPSKNHLIKASRFIAERKSSSPKIENCYYNSEATLEEIGGAIATVTETGTGKTVSELNDPSMASQLNVGTDVWSEKNGDCPVLKNIKAADYTEVQKWIDKANELDQSKYQDFSGVDRAVEDVLFYLNMAEQTRVNGYATAIEAAINALVEKTDPPVYPPVEPPVIEKANYIKVDEAIAKIPSDLNLYTKESSQAVLDAKDAVVRGKDVTEQKIVDGYAMAIEVAIKGLAYRGADYVKVDQAIAKIPADLNQYTDKTVEAVIKAKAAVVRGKNITEQKTVDGYANAIEAAIKGLVKKTLSAPKIKAEASSSSKIKVSWGKVKGAEGYRVYRYVSKNSGYKLIKTTKSDSFLDSGLKSETKYSYKVKAYAAGIVSASSNTASAKTERVYGNISFSLKKTFRTSILVQWKGVKGAKGYQIANCVKNEKMKIQYTSGSNSRAYWSLRKKSGKTYEFQMRYYKTVKGKKVWSPWSRVKTIKL